MNDNPKGGWTEAYLQGRQSGPIVIAIVAILIGVAVPVVWLVSRFAPAQLAAVALAAAAFAWLLSRHGVRAVAKHTLAQCIRMRIAIAFIVLLALVLTLLPRFMKGDGTLAGSIRTYLSYGVSITGGLLSIVTVLLAVAVVAWDVRERTIFLVSVKPVRRWEYLVGRWMGVMALNVALLAIAAGGIYVFVQYLRDGEATSDLDRRIVETEIFTARREVRPELPDFESFVRQRIAQMQREGYFAEAIDAYMASRALSREQAEEQLLAQLREDVRTATEMIPPGRGMRYRFAGIDVAGEATTAEGTVVVTNVERGQFRISAPQRVVGRLVYGGPVTVRGFRGRVVRLDPGRVDVAFPPPEMSHVELRTLKKDDAVTVTVEPTVQFRYKVVPTTGERSGTMGRVIQLEREIGGEAGAQDEQDLRFERMYSDYGSAPLNTMTTVTMPLFGPAAEGESDLAVVYANAPMSEDEAPRPVRIKYADVSLLYRVGGFEANFLRAIMLVFFQLAFLAAMGVFFGSFLSFPVAAFACMVLLVNGWMMEWLAEALQWGGGGFSQGLGVAMLHLLAFVLPDFSQTSPSQKLVDGLLVGWPTVAGVGAMTVTVRTVLYLLAGCLIFQRRELAGAETT
jgi:ABC-type transport system involved in multi-copper enzyme maturation permease subunit